MRYDCVLRFCFVWTAETAVKLFIVKFRIFVVWATESAKLYYIIDTRLCNERHRLCVKIFRVRVFLV